MNRGSRRIASRKASTASSIVSGFEQGLAEVLVGEGEGRLPAHRFATLLEGRVPIALVQPAVQSVADPPVLGLQSLRLAELGLGFRPPPIFISRFRARHEREHRQADVDHRRKVSAASAS